MTAQQPLTKNKPMSNFIPCKPFDQTAPNLKKIPVEGFLLFICLGHIDIRINYLFINPTYNDFYPERPSREIKGILQDVSLIIRAVDQTHIVKTFSRHYWHLFCMYKKSQKKPRLSCQNWKRTTTWNYIGLQHQIIFQQPLQIHDIHRVKLGDLKQCLKWELVNCEMFQECNHRRELE